MKTKFNVPLFCVLIVELFHSCGLMFKKIDCRSFEFEDDLKWYAGNAGEVVTLTNNASETKEFRIENKFITHTTQYISDTGCGCSDIWGMTLSADRDTITMYSESVYVYDNQAAEYDCFYIHHNGKLSGFINEDKSMANNYNINNVIFPQVMIFEYPHTEDSQFNRIVIAPETGIVELTETNGTVWTNMNLEAKLNTGRNTFQYSEITCE